MDTGAYDTVERLLDAMGHALVAISGAGQVTRLSQRAEALTGLSFADARGKPVAEVVRIVSAEDGTPLDDLVARALGGEVVLRSLSIRSVLVARQSEEHPFPLEAVAEAHRGSYRVAQIVRGLKIFSRGLDERRQPLDIAEVAESVLQVVANELRHRARVVREFYPAPPVDASVSHIGQVLMNL